MVIVGGGTAGAVIASRVSADPAVRVCLIEGGPSDVGDQRVLQLRNWLNLLETEYDYDYPIVPQPRGNSHLRHSRARVLGGCSSHNTMISFLPPPGDFADWVEAGATGWSYADMLPYWKRLAVNITPVAEPDRNPLTTDFVAACHTALGVPVIDAFNASPFADGTGFFPVGYHPETGVRSSASVAYLHPYLDRPNLTIMTETWAFHLDPADGVTVRQGEETKTIKARHEYVLSAGAIDTPRLLLLSGIGPAADLERLGIPVTADLPGVGDHLLDHPESLILWEASRPIPPMSAMDSDAGLFVRRDPAAERPALMFHLYQIPFTVNTERLGYDVPEHGFGMTPNVPRPLLFYFYEPQWLFAKEKYVRIKLPAYTEGCDADARKVACDYPDYDLDKIASKKFADTNSTAYQLIKNFQWTDDDQNLVSDYLTNQGMSADQAAEKWVNEHESTWKSWIPAGS